MQMKAPKKADDPYTSSNLFSAQPAWKQRKTKLAQENEFGGDGKFNSGAKDVEKHVPAAQRMNSVIDGPGLFGADDMIDKAYDWKPTKIGLFDNGEDHEQLEQQ